MKKLFLAFLLASQPYAVLAADADQGIICRRTKVEAMKNYQLLMGPADFTLLSDSGTILAKFAIDARAIPTITIAQTQSSKPLDLQAVETIFGKVKDERMVFRDYKIRTDKGDFVIFQIFVRDNELLKYRLIHGDKASDWRQLTSTAH